MNNRILAACAAFSPFALFAAGEGTMDTTAAVSLLTSAQTGLTGLLSSAMPIITTIILAGLAVWGGFALIRLVKRALRTGV